jgi:RNA polymerase sigma-70 factor (ECF subfamily)
VALSLEEQYGKIYTYCYFKTRNTALAEDITQETFLRFYARYHTIHHGKPLAYLYTVARNLCVDAFRKAKTDALPDDLPAMDTHLENIETVLSVRAALACLPEDSRELLLLRYANHLSMAEIGEITGLSRFAARRKINNALEVLKKTLRKEDFFDT